MIKIMIIDDVGEGSPEIQYYSDNLPANIEIIHFRNGAAAIQYLRAHKGEIKLILLDQVFNFGDPGIDRLVREKKVLRVPHSSIPQVIVPAGVLFLEIPKWSDSALVNQQGLIILHALQNEMKLRRISEIGVVFCSAGTDYNVPVAAINIGAKDFIEKGDFGDGRLTMLIEDTLSDNMDIAGMVAEAALENNLVFGGTVVKYLIAQFEKHGNPRGVIHAVCAKLKSELSDKFKKNVTLAYVKKAVETLGQERKLLQLEVPDESLKVYKTQIADLHVTDPELLSRFALIVKQLNRPCPPYSYIVLLCGQIVEVMARSLDPSAKSYGGVGKIIIDKVVYGMHKDLCIDIYADKGEVSHKPKEFTQKDALDSLSDTLEVTRKFLSGSLKKTNIVRH